MRILLDESAPRGLKKLLPGHEVKTVPEQGWASKVNGELLGLAVADRFDVFVTPDQNLNFQQNLSNFDIAVVVLATGRNVLSTYRPIADSLLEFVQNAKRGEAGWFTA